MLRGLKKKNISNKRLKKMKKELALPLLKKKMSHLKRKQLNFFNYNKLEHINSECPSPKDVQKGYAIYKE